MDRKQVDKLYEQGGFRDSHENKDFKETHISWIILTDHYAFKIKRPVKFPYLDYSTLAKRRDFCLKELNLNRRLAPDMYLRVVPITEYMVEKINSSDEPIDFAVQMKRMDNDKDMGLMLKKNQVNESHIDKLADKIASFHLNTRVIKNAFNTVQFQMNYAELEGHAGFIEKHLGKEWTQKVHECGEKSNVFLNDNRHIMNDRITRGFQKDCHGDLNAHNVFLYDDPVIFDCIEFNKSFRHIDVLNEIAFLCTELDFFDKEDLSQRFYTKYMKKLGADDDDNSKKLLNYYKSFRANVRAKVTIDYFKNNDPIDQKALDDVKKFITQMDNYLDRC